MLKKFIFILILFIISGVSACAQKSQVSCNKYSEQSLGISFCAPSDWTIIENPGESYKKVVGKKKDGLIPTINITSGDYEKSVTDYAINGIDYVKKNLAEKGYTSVEVESQSDFNGKNTNGYRIVYNTKIQGRGLRVIQYVFAGKGNMKIILTAYFLPSDKKVLDKVFDDSMKTFEISQ